MLEFLGILFRLFLKFSFNRIGERILSYSASLMY